MTDGIGVFFRVPDLAGVLSFEREELTAFPAYDSTNFWLSCIGAACATGLARYVLDRIVFQPFARAVLVDKSSSQDQGKLHNRIEKFKESLWKFLVYSALHAFGWYALYDKNWLWTTRNYWEEIPEQPQSKRVQELYILQIGFYFASLHMLHYWETSRKDYPVMLLHHCTALALILMSYQCGYVRVGSVILLLHDFSDILLELAKLFNYANMELPSTVAFVSMMASWLLLRLVLFPRHIIYSCSIEATAVLGRPVDHYVLFNSLLVCLLLMHVYWFTLIVRVAFTFLGDKPQPKDVREEDDD